MDFKFLDSIILDEEELINIRGGVSDGITVVEVIVETIVDQIVEPHAASTVEDL